MSEEFGEVRRGHTEGIGIRKLLAERNPFPLRQALDEPKGLIGEYQYRYG